jgi:phenylalanyl-tRNA synthetase beta chain
MSQVRVFETGKTFFRRMEEPAEKDELTIAASCLFARNHWKTDEQPFDFFEFKSLVSSVFKRSHLNHAFRKAVKTGYDPDCCFAIEVNGSPAGWIGQIGSEARDFFKLEPAVFAAELDVAMLISQVRENRFQSWNRFPLTKRDFSFWIARNIPYERLRSVIDELKPQVLESFELFDVYEGAESPGERVSLSMSFSYRSREKTLTNEEVNAIHLDFVGRMINRLDLIQR